MVAGAAYLGTVALFAQAPSWWSSRGVLNATPGVVTNDYAPVMQGQLKWLATQAAAEFDEKLSGLGGAGTGITALVASFTTNNNYRPVNAGQLKNTVAPFYDRLFALALTNCYPLGAGVPYPWQGATNPAKDFSLVNAGQAKYLFSFDLTGSESSTLNDGVPDWWKQLYGYTVTTAADTIAANGLTLIENYVKGLNPNQSLGVLTIPNAWAIYTNNNLLAVFADIRSSSNEVTVKAAEFFIDSTNGVVFGSGTAMSAVDGAFDSTNEMALALFTPTFAYGSRHIAFVHAQGSDNLWCPFVKVIINPNINDVLGKIQANYTAIHDLQFSVVFTETKNSIVTRSDIVAVKMKGPYKTVSDYSSGLRVIKNENTDWWTLPSVGGCAMQTGFNDNFDPSANRNADIFWDIPLWRTRMNNSIAGNPLPGTFDVAMTPFAGAIWEPQNMRVDFSRGFVSQLSVNDIEISSVMNYSSPMEVLPGVWLFTSHQQVLQFGGGFQIVTESILTDIKVNQGLNDTLFDIPTE